MKNLIVLTLLAACAMLILPSMTSAQCSWAPANDFGCEDFNMCIGDPVRTWCDAVGNVATGDVCVAREGASCFDSSRCQGWHFSTCGGDTPYCYCDAEYTNCGCKGTAKVDLLDFAAERSTEGVKLTWKTGQEVECGAFKILRCETATPGTCELWSHTELGMTIPCQDNPGGADYVTVDTTAKKDQSYSYYLREYDTTDRIFEYGPLFMAIDGSIENTGRLEPFESTFEVLTAPTSDDDDEEEDADEEPQASADDNNDSEGGCGKL